jgi:hypothetical protein
MIACALQTGRGEYPTAAADEIVTFVKRPAPG